MSAINVIGKGLSGLFYLFICWYSYVGVPCRKYLCKSGGLVSHSDVKVRLQSTPLFYSTLQRCVVIGNESSLLTSLMQSYCFLKPCYCGRCSTDTERQKVKYLLACTSAERY